MGDQDNRVMKLGAPLPKEAAQFALETIDGGEISIAEYAGKNLVLFFYPKDNTPGCTSEAKDFSALKEEFAATNTVLLGVSKDSAQKHKNFIAKHELTVDLVTDAAEGGLSDQLGIWTEKKNYGRTYMGMVRTTLLIDAAGKLVQIWSKVRVKDHAAAVLEAARAL